MTTVLIYTTPARGHLFPIMDTARALRESGHHVHVRTLAADVGVVEAAGLEASAMDPRIEARAINDWEVRSPLQSAARAVATFVDRAGFEVDDMRQAIATHKPNFVLVDTNAWGAQAVAETSGLPWGIWHPFPLPYPSVDAPPFGPGLPPPRGPLGRLRDRLLRPVTFRPFQKYLPDLNAVRARAGAVPLPHITALFERPPLLLLMTAEPFEYRRRDWPANVQLVGPGLWAPPPSSSAPFALPSQKPVVLVTCSTEFQDDGALITAAIAAFGKDDSVQLVCTTAGVDPAQFHAPPGVVLERFVPHTQLLPRTAVVVCHGGMGITQRALSAAVPVCVVPFGRDQLEVAQRVVSCGAGSMLARSALARADAAQRLRAAVDVARGKSAGATAIRDAFAAAGGAARAAQLIDARLAQPRTARA